MGDEAFGVADAGAVAPRRCSSCCISDWICLFSARFLRAASAARGLSTTVLISSSAAEGMGYVNEAGPISGSVLLK